MAYELELPPGVDPREYQFTAVDRVFDQWRDGVGNTMLLMPTGTGKTVTVGMLIQQAIHDHDWKTLFLAQRRKLVQQAANTFQRFGLVTAIEMAEMREREQAIVLGEPEVVVATVQSLGGDRLRSKSPSRFDLIVIDECHHALGADYSEVLDWFNAAHVLGITATADGSKRNLGNLFDTVAYRLTLRQAIDQQALVPIKIRSIPVPIDLTGLKMTKSDYSEAEIAERIVPMIEMLAYNIKVNIGSRQTIVFTPDLGTASAMASMLRGMGVSAKYVAGSAGTYGMPEYERDQILEEFEADKFQVAVSCDLLAEGYDCPQVSCVVICRPTQQRYKYVQMVGRGTRRCDSMGKEDLLVLDFDWQTDGLSKRLCVPVVLFADSIDAETADAVNNRAKNSKGKGRDGKPFDYDLLDAIKEAEKDRRFVREFNVQYTGKFAKKYEGVDFDPVGSSVVLDVKLKKRYDMNPNQDPLRGGGPATEAQVHRLKLFGIRNPEGMSKWGASKLIDKLMKRDSKGMASIQQLRRLLAAGVSEEQARGMSRRDASHVIGTLIESNPLTQGTFF